MFSPSQKFSLVKVHSSQVKPILSLKNSLNISPCSAFVGRDLTYTRDRLSMGEDLSMTSSRLLNLYLTHTGVLLVLSAIIYLRPVQALACLLFTLHTQISCPSEGQCNTRTRDKIGHTLIVANMLLCSWAHCACRIKGFRWSGQEILVIDIYVGWEGNIKFN